MFQCDICGSAYKRNGTLLLHQRRSKICSGARKKMEELKKHQEEITEEIKKKEEVYEETCKKLVEECKVKMEETDDKRINDTMNLHRELEETKDKLDYSNRELEFKEKEINMKQDFIDDLKKTLLRQSEIIAIHGIGGNAIKKEEPTVDITKIPEFKYTSFDDLSSDEKDKIATVMRDKDLTDTYTYVFKKYYITQPPNIKIKDYNRGKMLIFKDKKWQDITFDELNYNTFVKIREMLSIIIKPLLEKYEKKFENIAIDSAEKYKIGDLVYDLRLRDDIIHCTGQIQPKHSMKTCVLTRKNIIDKIKTMIKNNQN
jgi:hypothetical protein